MNRGGKRASTAQRLGPTAMRRKDDSGSKKLFQPYSKAKEGAISFEPKVGRGGCKRFFQNRTEKREDPTLLGFSGKRLRWRKRKGICRA